MSRLIIVSFLFVLIFISQCSKPAQTEYFVVLHNFDHPLAASLFSAGVEQATDSLNIETVLLSQQNELPQEQVDSLFKNTKGIAFSAPIHNDKISAHLQKAQKKQKPLVQFDQLDEQREPWSFINSDSYSAGRAAARHIIEQFGDNGRFGIITSTLDNMESTEGIRGFRDALSPTKWKQVNIITCGNGFEQALKQYRYATRFGNRIIWLFAGQCDDFTLELKNIKKDNFFIAIDLHPMENNIKFLQDNLLDAIATKDFANMGTCCVTELASTKTETMEAENTVINCGSTVLTSALLSEQTLF